MVKHDYEISITYANGSESMRIQAKDEIAAIAAVLKMVKAKQRKFGGKTIRSINVKPVGE